MTRANDTKIRYCVEHFEYTRYWQHCHFKITTKHKNRYTESERERV